MYCILIVLYCICLDEGRRIEQSGNPPLLFRDTFCQGEETWFFTDGSKYPDKPFAGFAVLEILPNGGIKTYRGRTNNNASIFTAEALAILEALNMIQNGQFTKAIFTDSMSVLQNLQSVRGWSSKSSLILEIQKRARALLLSGSDIRFFWIPAHSGIPYNEKVDLEAKCAAATGIDSQFLLPSSDFKAQWRQKMFSDSVSWIKTVGSLKGRNYVENYLSVDRYPWFHKLLLNRIGIVSVNRLRAGHTSLADSFHRHNIVDSPLCDCKSDIQSPNHVFWNCDLWIDQRLEMEGQLRKLGYSSPF